MEVLPLKDLKDRHEVIRYFDGYMSERFEELFEKKLRRPLVKTQLLELRDGQDGASSLIKILARHKVQAKPLDESMFLVTDEMEGEIGFLEILRPRIVAVYSPLRSNLFDRWVRRLVFSNHELDYVWLSGLTFGVLWELIVQLSQPHRFTRIVFTHDSIFEIDQLESEDEGKLSDLEEPVEAEELDDEGEIIERRATSFRLVDRVGVIKKKLKRLQEIYSPLYAISQLRFPSPVGRGGHDFYDNGRVTNRSESFRDHRSHLLFVVKIYEELLKLTEQRAWYSIQESVDIPGQFRKLAGAPVTVCFREQITQEVFDHWIKATFERKKNKFRLWGHPIRLGPTKVHVYGVDRHLWQPLFLELTAQGCTAILPNGTCGNTVHRLVTNIQRYLDPGATAFIGSTPYTEIVKESARNVPYDHNDN